MSKQRADTSKGPDPKSVRSKKRTSRGFKSVETSTRKGRRARARTAIACILNGTPYKPGDKVLDNSARKTQSFMCTAGGSIRYHSS